MMNSSAGLKENNMGNDFSGHKQVKRVLKTFNGKLWQNFMNSPGESDAQRFQEVAAKHGLTVLVNQECYDSAGNRMTGDHYADWWGYWIPPGAPPNFTEIWKELKEPNRRG